MVRDIRWCARFSREPPAIHRHTSGALKALVIEIEASPTSAADFGEKPAGRWSLVVDRAFWWIARAPNDQRPTALRCCTPNERSKTPTSVLACSECPFGAMARPRTSGLTSPSLKGVQVPPPLTER